MGAFLQGIEGVLSSPAAQELIPAVVGGVGSALSTPRGSGVKAEIGNALQGGARGYEQGIQNQKEGLETQLLQQQVAQMKLVTQNQGAIQKMLPTWLKDIPDDQKPVFTALMTSGDPKDIAQATSMRTAILAKPQTIKQLSQMNPALTPAFLQTQDPVELSKMVVDLEKQKPSDNQVRVQAYIADHAAEYKKNPAQVTWDAQQAAAAVAPEAKLPAELAAITARGEQQRETVVVRDEDRPAREPKAPGTYWDPKQGKNVLADPESAIARGLEPAHEKGGDEPGKEAKDAHAIIQDYTTLNGARPSEGYFDGGKARKTWDDGLRAVGVDPDSGKLLKDGGDKNTPTPLSSTAGTHTLNVKEGAIPAGATKLGTGHDSDGREVTEVRLKNGKLDYYYGASTAGARSGGL